MRFCRLDTLIPFGLDEVRLNIFFPKGLVGFQAVDAFDQNITSLTKAHLDWPFLDAFHHFLGRSVNRFGVYFLTTIQRYVDFRNFRDNGFEQRKLPFYSFYPSFPLRTHKDNMRIDGKITRIDEKDLHGAPKAK
jgi:hypothetical protein